MDCLPLRRADHYRTPSLPHLSSYLDYPYHRCIHHSHHHAHSHRESYSFPTSVEDQMGVAELTASAG